MEEILTAKVVESMKDDLYAKQHLCEKCIEKHKDIILVGNNCENLCVNWYGKGSRSCTKRTYLGRSFH